MKLSLAWIFDHIDADWRKVDIPNLIERFNMTTAEIEGVQKIHVDLDAFTLAQVKKIADKKVTLYSPELKKDIILPIHNDVHSDKWYLVKKLNDEYAWVRAYDFGSEKDMIVPALYVPENQRAGEWKKHCEVDDYILEVDNKSITNRPDMWGHRGFAREIAAILQVPLKPYDKFLADLTVEQFDTKSPATNEQPYAIEIKDTKGCKRFAGLYIDAIENKSSLLWMAHRLIRVDNKPINAVIDATNYTMLDTSQPLHAYDADKLSGNAMIARHAKNGDKFTFLDGDKVTLTHDDMVIADKKEALCVAGVMGGLNSGISMHTNRIFLESANFNAATIRHTAERCKKRTESSARFEKSLDPNQNITGIKRFAKLLQDAHFSMVLSNTIMSVGKPVEPITVKVSHQFIEDRLGIKIDSDVIIQILTRLGFKINESDNIYTITVPTFRATKDIGIKEDIVEEVGRFVGYSNIEPHLPLMQLKPSDTRSIYVLRTIRNILSYSLLMHELRTYAFFDESFLQKIKWEPGNTIVAQSPVSENWKHLVTTLVPGLLKAIEDNCANYDQLRFYEWARVWHKSKKKVLEQKVLAGIIFNKKEAVDFYNAKAQLHILFNALRLPVTWEQVDKPHDPWYAPFQTAHLKYGKQIIGTVGKVNKAFFGKITEGDAFIFELDGQFLLEYQPEAMHYVPASKYPAVTRDISMIVPVYKTVEQLTESIKGADDRIVNAILIDFFQKDDWEDQKSLAFRFVIRDYHKTLTKEEVDIIWDAVAKNLKKQGATIR